MDIHIEKIIVGINVFFPDQCRSDDKIPGLQMGEVQATNTARELALAKGRFSKGLQLVG